MIPDETGTTDHIGDGFQIPPGLEEIDQAPDFLPEGTVTTTADPLGLGLTRALANVGLFLDEARSWLGTAEQPMGSNYVPGITDQDGFWNDAWCAMYGSVVCRNVGIPLWTVAVAGIMSTAQNGVDGWQWLDHPVIGAMPCYDWRDGGQRTDHVGGGGIEAIRDDGLLVVIEGNTGDMVKRVVRDPSNFILGFALPPFGVSEPPPPYVDPDPLHTGDRLVCVVQ